MYSQSLYTAQPASSEKIAEYTAQPVASAKVAEVKLSQLLKAYSPIEVRLAGKLTLVIPVHP